MCPIGQTYFVQETQSVCRRTAFWYKRNREFSGNPKGAIGVKVHILGAWGAYPEAGEATTGLLLEEGDTRILIDCGSGVLAQLFKEYQMRDLSALIVTHHHHDHTADLGVFTYALLISRLTKQREEKLPVYMPDGPKDRIHSFQKERLAALQLVHAKSKVRVGEVDLSFVETIHPVPCLAIRAVCRDKVFVFSADTSYSEKVIALASGADVFLCESSMYAGMEADAKKAGHVTAPQAGEMAQQAGAKRLLLTHFPHYGNLEDLVAQAKTTFDGVVERVHTGMVVEV